MKSCRVAVHARTYDALHKLMQHRCRLRSGNRQNLGPDLCRRIAQKADIPEGLPPTFDLLG
jgi:hypothetical protein